MMKRLLIYAKIFVIVFAVGKYVVDDMTKQTGSFLKAVDDQAVKTCNGLNYTADCRGVPDVHSLPTGCKVVCHEKGKNQILVETRN